MVNGNAGHILAGTNIAVDWWGNDTNGTIKYHFASHLTSEHISGLGKKWRTRIYCSEISAELLVSVFKVPRTLVTTLSYNEVTRLGDDLAVTMYDANHCVGSSMFLFEGSFGRILYTGSFRWYPGITNPFSGLLINEVYFDNTYSRKAAKFISREECKEAAARLCASHVRQGKLVFFVLDFIGKEDILSYVAEVLKLKIVVTKEKMAVVESLGLGLYFTEEEQGGTIYWISKNRFNFKKSIPKLRMDYDPKELVFVKISGMRRGQNCMAYEYINFSAHSSMQEIECFFECIHYQSATPIAPREEREKRNLNDSKAGPDEPKGKKSKQPSNKVKLRRNDHKEEIQTSFSITSEFEATTVKPPTYRVSSGLTTDEEVGDSPNSLVLSPSKTAASARLCSTPVNDDKAQELAVFNDNGGAELGPVDLSEYRSPSPDNLPYIEPPVPLEDWPPSPISSSVRRKPALTLDKDIIHILSSSGSSGGVSGLSTPSLPSESSVELNRNKHFSSESLGLSPCDVGMICNSPIYHINGQVSYPFQNPTISKEGCFSFGSENTELGSYKSNVSQLYDEMFRESETPLETYHSPYLSDNVDDGISILNDTPDSVESLYVCETEEESDDETKETGPIAGYLRGQYALNQIFNNSLLNIRDAFSGVRFPEVPLKERVKRRSTEQDLEETKTAELLLPNIDLDQQEETADLKDPSSPVAVLKELKLLECEPYMSRDPELVELREAYYRRLSEIVEKGRKVTYRGKPKKIGKSTTHSSRTRTLLTDSMKLTNNYADPAMMTSLHDIAFKLTTDTNFTPRSKPVLKIKKEPLPAVTIKSYPELGGSCKMQTNLSIKKEHRSFTSLTSPPPRTGPVQPTRPIPVKSIPGPSDPYFTPLSYLNTPIAKYASTPPIPKYASMPSIPKYTSTPSIPKLASTPTIPKLASIPQVLKFTSSSNPQSTPKVGKLNRKKATPSSTPKDGSGLKKKSGAALTSPDNIFDVLFGSAAPALAPSKKSKKKREGGPVVRKKVNIHTTDADMFF